MAARASKRGGNTGMSAEELVSLTDDPAAFEAVLARIDVEKVAAHAATGEAQAAAADLDALKEQLAKREAALVKRENTVEQREREQAKRDAWWQQVKAWLDNMSAEMRAERAARVTETVESLATEMQKGK